MDTMAAHLAGSLRVPFVCSLDPAADWRWIEGALIRRGNRKCAFSNGVIAGVMSSTKSRRNLGLLFEKKRFLNDFAKSLTVGVVVRGEPLEQRAALAGASRQ